MASRVRITHASERKVVFAASFAICSGRGQFTSPLKQSGENWDELDDAGKALVAVAFDVEGTDHVRVSPYRIEVEVAELFTVELVRRKLREFFQDAFEDRHFDFEYGDEVLSETCEIQVAPFPDQLFDDLKERYTGRSIRRRARITVNLGTRPAYPLEVCWYGLRLMSTNMGGVADLIVTMRVPGGQAIPSGLYEFEYIGPGSKFIYRR